MVAHCPEHMLGKLKADSDPTDHPHHTPGVPPNTRTSDATLSQRLINEMPQELLEELRRLGIPLSWYTYGELRDARNAFALDARLIDDPQGVHFRDKLSLTDEEKKTRTKKQKGPHAQTHSFCKALERERNNSVCDDEPVIWHL